MGKKKTKQLATATIPYTSTSTTTSIMTGTVRKKGFQGPGHLVSSADWMAGTARTCQKHGTLVRWN